MLSRVTSIDGKLIDMQVQINDMQARMAQLREERQRLYKEQYALVCSTWPVVYALQLEQDQKLRHVYRQPRGCYSTRAKAEAELENVAEKGVTRIIAVKTTDYLRVEDVFTLDAPIRLTLVVNRNQD